MCHLLIFRTFRGSNLRLPLQCIAHCRGFSYVENGERILPEAILAENLMKF